MHMSKKIKLIPLFDSLEFISKTNYCFADDITVNHQDANIALSFLRSYVGSQGTFNSYRREIERLLQWSALIPGKNLNQLNKEDIEAFVKFCQNPNHEWISYKKSPKFLVQEGIRIPNPVWRPFVVTISKAEHKKGKQPELQDFALSNGAIKGLFAILNSFFNYLLQEEYITSNPVALIRQKSKFIRKQQSKPKIRRLSELQWKHTLQAAEELASNEPNLHERTLFIMSAFYLMYLRISELVANERWVPTMHDFSRDNDKRWWFTTVGKGNKERQIAVSDSMLHALKRWRTHLGLTPLPSSSDNSPLIPKTKGKGPISSTTYLRDIVQLCFDKAYDKLKSNNLMDEADSLMDATVHWLRHTGISEDVKIRPREHVRDDAGHSSSAITDKYIDIEMKERHKSAKGKEL